MTQTGTGCLNMQHIATLRSGHVTIVPPSDTSDNDNGREEPLWIMDPTLLPSHVTQGHQPWIGLYVGMACTCRQSHSPGITLSCVIRPMYLATPSTSGMLVTPSRIHKMLFVQAALPHFSHLLDFMGYQHQ